MKTLGYYNGKFGPLEEMTVPMNDRACYFGDGVYEATLARNGKIFALKEHLDRFFNSAGIRQHQFPEKGTKPNLWIFMKPGKPADSSKRLKLTDVEDTRFLHCNIKTLNLLVNVMAAEKAESMGCGECVFHRGDVVTECAHSNVSIIKDGIFKTHPTDHYILPGITRMHIIQICKDNGIPVDETPFTMAELMDADEIIVSSSTKFCSPACEMNGTPIGGKAPELVKLIQEKYMEKFENETAN